MNLYCKSRTLCCFAVDGTTIHLIGEALGGCSLFSCFQLFHLGDARVSRIDPFFANNLLESQVFGHAVEADHLVAILVDAVDARLLIAQRHALEAVAFHRFLDHLAKLRVLEDDRRHVAAIGLACVGNGPQVGCRPVAPIHRHGHKLQPAGVERGWPENQRRDETIAQRRYPVGKHRIALRAIAEMAANLVGHTAPELCDDIFSNGIISTGDSAEINLIGQTLTDRIEAPVSMTEQSKSCVAKGLHSNLVH